MPSGITRFTSVEGKKGRRWGRGDKKGCGALRVARELARGRGSIAPCNVQC